MIKYILSFLLAVSPCYAKCDAGDLAAHIEAVHGTGALVSVAVDNDKVTKIDFAPGVSDQLKADITATANAFDLKQKGRRDINQDIQKEIESLANDKAIEDGKQADIRAKLIRATEMTELQDKKDKLQEAKDAKLEAMKLPNNKPRIVMKQYQPDVAVYPDGIRLWDGEKFIPIQPAEKTLTVNRILPYLIMSPNDGLAGDIEIRRGNPVLPQEGGK